MVSLMRVVAAAGLLVSLIDRSLAFNSMKISSLKRCCTSTGLSRRLEVRA